MIPIDNKVCYLGKHLNCFLYLFINVKKNVGAIPSMTLYQFGLFGMSIYDNTIPKMVSVLDYLHFCNVN